MFKLVHFLIFGYFILLGAILMNFLAKFFGLLTWYDLLTKINSQGVFPSLKEASIASLVFLFLIYPLILGSIAWLVQKNLSQ